MKEFAISTMCPPVAAGRALLTVVLAGALFGTAPAGAAEVNLRFMTTLPQNNPVTTRCFAPWVKKANKAGEGEFHITLAQGMGFASPQNIWGRVVDGVGDIGWGIHGAVNRPFPKTNIIGLPFLAKFGEEGKAGAALWKVYEAGLMKDEYDDVHLLALASTGTQGLTTKTKFATMDDIKGMKIRAADKTASNIVAALGGSPISMPAPDVFQAISQGVAQGSIANPILLVIFKLAEVAKYHTTNVSFGSPSGFVIMNKRSYAKLSPKGKNILDKLAGRAMSYELSDCFYKLDADLFKKLQKDPEQHMITLSPAELERWKKATNVVVTDWVKNTPDGEKIMSVFKKAMNDTTN